MMDLVESEAPDMCPNCGQEPTALVVVGDPQTNTIYAEDACEVERDDLPLGLGWVNKVVYIHGGDV
jgi:hypothetical protein